MKAIIMAGGEGTRLKSVTGDLPKPLVPLAGRPVLEHILLLLRRNGVRDVCMALHYRPELIQERFGDGSALGMRVSYQVETRPLGTAGAVRACADFYGERDFLVISGDGACDFDLKPLMEAHRRHRSAVTMALYPQSEPLQYGTVLFDRQGRVVSFTEKPGWERVVTDMVNTGIYVLSPAAMALVPEETPFDFSKDLFPALMERGMEIRALPMEGYWCDIGTPRAYHQCCLDALDGKLRLEQESPAAPPPTERRQTESGGVGRELPCRDRARAMRFVSQVLMEAGADFSDGLRLSTAEGSVRITPDPEREALRVHAEAESPEAAQALALRVARELELGGV